MRYNKTIDETGVIGPEEGNISQTEGKQFPIVTSTPVTICVGLI